MSLILEIQAAALDSAVHLPDLLRKCKVLAARLKHQPFADWVSSELSGYRDLTEPPDYRRIKTQSYGNFVGSYGRKLLRVPIPTFTVPERFRANLDEIGCRQSVSALAELLASGDGDLSSPWSPDFIGYCQHNAPMYEGMTLLSAWRSVGRADIKAILDTTRTRILDFVLAIGDQAPGAGDVPPGSPPAVPHSAVTQTFYTTIYGGQSSVGMSGGRAQLAMGAGAFSTAIPVDLHGELRAELQSLHNKIDGLAANARSDAAEALGKVESELASPTPDAARIERYLSVLANITSILQPHADAIMQVMARLAGA